LAKGVGREFSPNDATDAELKRLGINRLRCINVDPLPGSFDAKGDFVMTEPTLLLNHLKTCRKIGATPHICIAILLHPELKLAEENIPEAERGVMGNETKKNEYGPTDWTKFRTYYKRYFKYVLVEQGFRQARFEVGNEPDTAGIFVPRPPKPPRASRAAYEAYLEVYRNVAQAAAEFERENPGYRITMGGPAITTFAFKFGELNWAEQFARDCAQHKLRVDFFGLHLYGNMSSFRNPKDSLSGLPPLVTMIQTVQKAIAEHIPGTPLIITEWGPSYTTTDLSTAIINENHVGAAWCAEFLNTLRLEKIDSALFLLTTDPATRLADGTIENRRGWPALFLNPKSHKHKAYPKPIFHVLDMITKLAGQEIQLGTSHPIGIFASIDKQTKRITLMAWNYDAIIPPNAPITDRSKSHVIDLAFKNLPTNMQTGQLRIRRWQVSENQANVSNVLAKKQVISVKNTALPRIENKLVSSENGGFVHQITMPPSSVTFIEIASQSIATN
jgi:hypothetical protein